MKIILINPSIDPKKFGKAHVLMEPMPCIGLACIASVLERDGHSVTIMDNYVLKYSSEELSKKILQESPDVVGVSVLTPNVNFALDIAKIIKNKNSDIKLIAGNVHPTQFPEEFLDREHFDVVVRGEGEETISELLTAFDRSSELPLIKGISYLDGNSIINNERRSIIKDLDSLPYPAWHLLPYEKYGLFPFADIKKPVLTILATRGCPFKCKYCSLSYMDRTYRKRSVNSVVSEIEYIVEKFAIKQFAFVDPTFPLEEDYALQLCDEIKSRGLHKRVVWLSETRIDILTEKMIIALRSAGCRRLIFGLESGSAQSLAAVDKRLDFEDSKRVLKLLKKHKMESIGLFMIGMPGESREDILQTFKYARDLDVDFAKFAMTVPFPGSELYETILKEGKIRTRNWDDYTTFNPIPEKVSYVPDGMTPEELIYLQKKGHIDFYVRPRMIFRQLFQIRTLPISMMLKGLYAIFGK